LTKTQTQKNDIQEKQRRTTRRKVWHRCCGVLRCYRHTYPRSAFPSQERDRHIAQIRGRRTLKFVDVSPYAFDL